MLLKVKFCQKILKFCHTGALAYKDSVPKGTNNGIFETSKPKKIPWITSKGVSQFTVTEDKPVQYIKDWCEICVNELGRFRDVKFEQ